jgi:hypothetical protein
MRGWAAEMRYSRALRDGSSSALPCHFSTPTSHIPQAFNALRDAFDLLTDEKKRKAYDDQLAREEWKAAQRKREQRAAAARAMRAAAIRLGSLALTHRRVTLGLVFAAAVLMRMPLSAEPPSEI